MLRRERGVITVVQRHQLQLLAPRTALGVDGLEAQARAVGTFLRECAGPGR